MMTLYINATEAAWLVLSGFAIAYSLALLVDAWSDRKTVHLLNGHAREMQADLVLEGEAMRLVLGVLLLLLALPALFTDLEATVTIGVAYMMLFPILLLVWSYRARRYRKRLTSMTAAAVATERGEAMDRIEDAIAENTHLTIKAAEAANEASANADDAHREAQIVEEKVTDTRDRVIDLQERSK